MQYFTPSYFDFFDELDLNNSKVWFDENRTRYENQIRQPFKIFISDCIERLSEIDPTLSTSPSESIFRINRDIRFSANKTPYKVFCAAALATGGKKVEPTFYLHIGSKEAFVAGGIYAPTPAQLSALRQDIIAHPKELSAALTHPSFVRLYGTILGNKNKVLPPLFRQHLQDEPLLAFKQMYYTHSLSRKQLTSTTLLETITMLYLASKPLQAIFSRALKNSITPAALS